MKKTQKWKLKIKSKIIGRAKDNHRYKRFSFMK